VGPALIALPARVFRLSRSPDPLKLTSWEYIRQGARGRWDDTVEDYRVLYCSDSEVGAFVEVLQDLRQDATALEMLEGIAGDDETESSRAVLVRVRLQNRWSGVLIPNQPEERVVDVHHGATRSFLESALGSVLIDLDYPTLKVGDAIGSNRHVSRMASRLFYDAKLNGVRARSAEHAPSEMIALFETHPVSGRVRVGLVHESVTLALERGDKIFEAAMYLGLVQSNV